MVCNCPFFFLFFSHLPSVRFVQTHRASGVRVQGRPQAACLCVVSGHFNRDELIGHRRHQTCDLLGTLSNYQGGELSWNSSMTQGTTLAVHHQPSRRQHRGQITSLVSFFFLRGGRCALKGLILVKHAPFRGFYPDMLMNSNFDNTLSMILILQ